MSVSLSLSLSVCVCVCLKSSPPTLLCVLQKDVVVSFPRPPVHFWGPFSGRQTGPKCKKNCSAGLEMRPFSGLHFGPPVAPKVASRRLVGLAALVAVSGARKRALSVPCHGPLASFESHGTQLVQGVKKSDRRRSTTLTRHHVTPTPQGVFSHA